MSKIEAVKYGNDELSWNPDIGDNFKKLINKNDRLSDEEKQILEEQTHSILEKCVPPGQNKNSTGLVIGYVQSGKTLSFTSLSAMAKDNNFQLVIVLAGTKNNLVEQSYERLRKDLGVGESREWKVFTTRDRKFQKAEVNSVNATFDRWRRGGGRSAPSVMIIAMKQHHHLDSLADLMQDCNLDNISVLIVDDEGDQAGLNTKVHDEEESTTYSKIKKLRDVFPAHSYVLYTATPQAPMLISRIDFLSPDFGKVISPGSAYVGGKEFFAANSPYVRTIPLSDIPDKEDPPVTPPQTLVDALLAFFTGVAVGLLDEEDIAGENRSMMIHPDVSKDSHLMFNRWISNIKEEWKRVLSKKRDDIEYQNLIKKFQKQYHDLVSTNGTHYCFEDIEGVLIDAVCDTVIREINTRTTNKIGSVEWQQDYSWILIGGLGLDRGFTVEGLTVSYMPRSIGGGNVDNIQQRARFFGYKKNYLGLCRIYLSKENQFAFKAYVEHEENIRKSISEHLAKGLSLKDWRRAFFLEPGLKATRSSVISLDMYPLSTRTGWIVPSYPFVDDDACEKNRQVIDQILNDGKYSEYREHGWNDKQAVPKYSGAVDLSAIYRQLSEISYGMPEDDMQHAGVMMALDGVLAENPNAKCSVYAFAGPWSGVDVYRGLSEKNPPKIKQFFQGANAKTNYPGAREIKSDETVTIQIHRYNLRRNGEVIYRDVPTIAIHIPKSLRKTAHIEGR